MDMSRPHVTVAMITYNHEKYIASAVKSILAQTYEDFELVIVDDGSSDATSDIIRGFTDPRIRYIWQENQGPSEARNTALKEARGELLAQMSGDDIAAPARLRCQVDCHDRMPHNVIFSHCKTIDDSDEYIEAPGHDQCFNHGNWAHEATLRHLFLHGNCFLAPSAMAATDHFRAVGPYSPQLLQLQDYDMWVRFLLADYGAFIIENPLLHYRVRSDGGNLTGPLTKGTANRLVFEQRLILRRFMEIQSAERLANIFPEVTRIGYPIDDDLCPFLLIMVTLLREHKHTMLPIYGAEFLMDLMSDADQRKMLKEKAGFTNSDLYRTLGDVKVMSTLDSQTRIEKLEAEISRLHSSTSWRLTSPLRQLMSHLQGLRQLL